MKSTEDKLTFSMEDFEKGLMLAGFIAPSSISEIREREEVEAYERELDKEKQQLFFKRVVLAAEIAAQLYSEPTFGRIKFQKLVFLCEHAAGMKLMDRYLKFAAGPFDNRFMHSIEKEFKKNKWFNVVKITENNFTRSQYIPMPNLSAYKKYYDSYFSQVDSSIQYIINLFRRERTDTAEIAATLYACLVELMRDNHQINKENLLTLFYNWSDKKRRFDEELVISVWSWMRDKGITPSEA